MRPFLAIARITFVEVTRRPAYGILVLGTVLVQVLSPALAMFGFEQESALMKDFAVSTILLGGVLVAALGASTVMQRELETGTIQTLLAKPVSRWVFLAGKLAALASSLVPLMYLSLLALLMAARQGPPQTIHDPWDGPVLAGGLGAAALTLVAGGARALRSPGRSVTSFLLPGSIFLTAGWLLAALFDKGWSLQRLGAGFDPHVAEAVVLAFLASVLLCAIALLVSLWLARATFAAVLVIFFTALAVGGADSPWLGWLPAFEVFWIGDVFYRPETVIPAGYFAAAALYAFSGSLVCLLVGAWVVRRWEVG